ncbi:MAG TPA: cytochrome c peroxidase, partial [Chitinophagaceae bacterium]|nr:cytochrome c peroxidase [Chitinophagaceae bacterium]
MKKFLFSTFICLVIVTACRKDELQVTPTNSLDAWSNSDAVNYSVFILPESDHYDSIPQDPLNPLTSEKVELGKLLFHEAKLGGNPRFSEGLYTYSCASCHHAEAG